MPRRRFPRDDSGSVAVTVAMATSLLFGVAAVTVDASRFYLAKRRQQSMADLAAIAAAANIGSARAAAAASLAANGVPASALVAVDLGTYVADPNVAASQRFTLGSASPNAARVTLRSAVPGFFGAVIGGAAATIGARSVAANANVAAFTLSSTLLAADTGLANRVLGALTRSSQTLSAGDFAALAGANLDLFAFANAAAARAGVSGSYGTLAASTMRVADVLNAAADAAAAGGAPGAAVAAMRSAATAIGPAGPSLPFGSLVSFGIYAGRPVGSPAPFAAPLSLLPLMTAAARIAAGSSNISTDLGASDAIVTGASVRMVLGSAGASFAAIGPVGTTLHTGQARVALTLQLAQSGDLTALNLPIVIELAPATATLTALGCSAGASVDPAATLSVTPGVAQGWIGSVSDAALGDLTTPLNPGVAQITNVPLLPFGPPIVALTGRANATIANASATAEPFTLADIAAGRSRTTTTTDLTSSLLSSLFANLQLSASVAGLPIGVPLGAPKAVVAVLQADLAAIDAELTNTLAVLGLTVGDATTQVRSARCGQGALVN